MSPWHLNYLKHLLVAWTSKLCPSSWMPITFREGFVKVETKRQNLRTLQTWYLKKVKLVISKTCYNKSLVSFSHWSRTWNFHVGHIFSQLCKQFCIKSLASHVIKESVHHLNLWFNRHFPQTNLLDRSSPRNTSRPLNCWDRSNTVS